MYQEYYEIDESLVDTFEQSHHEPGYAGVKKVMPVLLIIMGIAIAFSVSTERIVMCLLAYANCVFLGFGLWRFLRKGTLAAMVPVLYIPISLLGWPVAILYFAIFFPEGYYTTRTGAVSYFDEGIRVQLCVLLFFLGYFSIMFWALRNEQRVGGGAINRPTAFAILAIFLGLPVVFFNALSKVVKFPDFVTYVVDGLFKYLSGIFFIVGALIKNIPIVVQTLFFTFIGFAVLFYTVGNARGQAVYCVLSIVLGILFFSGISRKTKITLLIGIAFAFPVYVTISSTTREILKTIGYEEGFGYRLQVLKEWRMVKAEKPPLAFTMGRLFYTGGHSIIAQTPSRVPYRSFSPVKYPQEMLESLIPGRFFYKPYYRGETILIDYGFLITEETAVGLSMLASFWFLGGYASVFFGGIALGLLHWLVIIILQKSWVVSEAKAFVYFGIFAPVILWAPRIPFIDHWHVIVYNIVFATLIYQIVKVVIGDYRDMTDYSESSYVLPEQEERGE